VISFIFPKVRLSSFFLLFRTNSRRLLSWGDTPGALKFLTTSDLIFFVMAFLFAYPQFSTVTETVPKQLLQVALFLVFS